MDGCRKASILQQGPFLVEKVFLFKFKSLLDYVQDHPSSSWLILRQWKLLLPFSHPALFRALELHLTQNTPGGWPGAANSWYCSISLANWQPARFPSDRWSTRDNDPSALIRLTQPINRAVQYICAEGEALKWMGGRGEHNCLGAKRGPLAINMVEADRKSCFHLHVLLSAFIDTLQNLLGNKNKIILSNGYFFVANCFWLFCCASLS